MVSEGKKLFPKALHLGEHIICLFFMYFYSLFEFFIYIIFYIYIVIFNIFYIERPNVVKELQFSIRNNTNNPYKSINVLLDLPLQLENK